MECERLKQLGLITIDHEQMAELHDVKVLLRAHGEPPETYELARRNNIEIIDATCPVVLQLQKKIKRQYESGAPSIVIFGKPGHAEVMGLVGQTGGNAIVIAHFDDVKKLDFSRDIYLYSQTTKSLDEFHRIISYIQEYPGAHLARGPFPEFRYHLPSGGQPHAQYLSLCCPPRPYSFCLRTEEQQRSCALRGMSTGQPQQPPHRRCR